MKLFLGNLEDPRSRLRKAERVFVYIPPHSGSNRHGETPGGSRSSGFSPRQA